MGAVSPAGWSVAALRNALARGEPLPTQFIERPYSQTEPSSIIHHPSSHSAQPTSHRSINPSIHQSAHHPSSIIHHPSSSIPHLSRTLPQSYRARVVPPPAERPAFLSHPRLRRASPLTQFAAAAALEAGACVPSNARRGLIVCLQSGPVQYVSRFMEEILKDPAVASPLVFPETVFAAPASHVAAVFGDDSLSYTLLGDPASFLQGVALATQWLDAHRLDACLVVGAEEINWIHAEALWHFQREAIASAGAGALCLTHNPDLSIGIELEAITDAHMYSNSCSMAEAARNMRAQLQMEPQANPSRSSGLGSVRPRRLPDSALNQSPSESGATSATPYTGATPSSTLLCDGLGGTLRSGAAEKAAWADWAGPRISPKQILGEGLMAAAAWQCVAACDALTNEGFASAIVSLVGCDQQAIGARFGKAAAVGQNSRNLEP
ncbi:MAG: hypothetical protein C5B50_09520 [Verrucomicrobia bacterium]|nr:MAG: hypothetical protein C5B50_09520 [Verrucomicrobiota bacterium]